jgi:hypothetical protein
MTASIQETRATATSGNTEIAAQPLVALRRKDYSEYHRILERIFAPISAKPRIAVECDRRQFGHPRSGSRTRHRSGEHDPQTRDCFVEALLMKANLEVLPGDWRVEMPAVRDLRRAEDDRSGDARRRDAHPPRRECRDLHGLPHSGAQRLKAGI